MVSITLNMVASKSIIVDLNHRDKLNEKSYDVWHCKIEYLLKEQEILETITQPMAEPSKETHLSMDFIFKHIKPINTKIM